MVRRGLRALAALLAVMLVAGAATLYLTQRTGVDEASSAKSTGGATYQCAMHPQIVAHEPGKCPICQMDLQRVDDPAASAPTTARAIRAYRHPMRPDITSPVPAQDEMGMDYVPVYEEEGAGGEEVVAGRAPFDLPAQRQQLIGVTRGKAEWRALEVEIRAAGRVAYDPSLYQAVVEYREALRSKEQLRGSSLRETHEGADAIVRAAKLKLRQKGLAESQILQIAGNSSDPTDLLLPGDSVWIYAQVHEDEAPLVRPGQTMTISVPSQPGRQLTAKVTAIDPILDPATRTVRVRGLVRDSGESLRPESFVGVKIHVPLGEKLAVPKEAILDTGEHQIAFVVSGDGRFEPRSITLGRAAGGYFEVLSGVKRGEEVVTSANFLIDSESRFRAALAAFKSSSAPPSH